MVKIIRKKTTLEKALAHFFGDKYKESGCQSGFYIYGLMAQNKCPWVPKNLEHDNILCPTDYLPSMIEFAEYLEKQMGHTITIKET